MLMAKFKDSSGFNQSDGYNGVAQRIDCSR